MERDRLPHLPLPPHHPHPRPAHPSQPADRRRRLAPRTPTPPFQRDVPPHLDIDKRPLPPPPPPTRMPASSVPVVPGLPARPVMSYEDVPRGPRERGREREREREREAAAAASTRRDGSQEYRRRDRRSLSPPRRSRKDDRSPSPPRRLRKDDRSPSPPRRSRKADRSPPPRRRPRSPTPSDVSDRSRSPPRRRHRHSRSPSPSTRRSRSPTPRRTRHPPRSPSPPPRRRSRRSRSRTPDASDSEADTEDERRRKRRRRRSERERSGSGERDRERKKAKKDKKDKKDKKKKPVSSTLEWGKYGLISESDMHTKDEEFRSWLLEERLLNPESLSKDATKREFARFVEDFNTATLPHEKYYSHAAYSSRMAALRGGETLPDSSVYDPAKDLAEMRARQRRPAEEKESFLSKEELRELRRVERERVEMGKMRGLGMEVRASMGVRMDGGGYEEN